LKWKTTNSGDGSKALSDTVCKKASKGVSGPARRERKRGRAVEMALGIRRRLEDSKEKKCHGSWSVLDISVDQFFS
jgi:hypothetical protein